MSFLLAFIAFAVLIVLHEAGHFVAAKAVGMRVEKFYLFFPPRVTSVTRGETEYGIGAIPLGGYVKISGMNPDEELPPEVAARGYYRQPVWKRIVVIAAGPLVNIVIAFVILFVLALGVPQASSDVDRVEPGSPAAGKLKVGDRIVAVDGVKGDQARLAEQIGSHRCAGGQTAGCRAETAARIEIIRDGQPKTLHIRPQYDAETERSRIGFAFGLKPGGQSAGAAARDSLDYMWLVTSQTARTIVQLYDEGKRKELTGIAGGYEVTRQAIDVGARPAFTLIALISLSLGLINLLPFLPLDGGHIFWSLVEKVRGRPVPFSVMEKSGVVGFVLIIALFLIGLSNDVGRFIGDGFNLR